MVVLVSMDEEESDCDHIAFEGVFADKDECLAALPTLVTGVEVEGGEEDETVKFDPAKHEIELKTSTDAIDVQLGAAPTEQLEVLLNFGDDVDDDELVETGYYVLCFDTH